MDRQLNKDFLQINKIQPGKLKLLFLKRKISPFVFSTTDLRPSQIPIYHLVIFKG